MIKPNAATATTSGFLANYSSPPEIFEGAGINVSDWAYRIYSSSGSYAVVATPRCILDKNEPTESEVKATNCYFIYHWKHRYPITSYLVAFAVSNYEQYTDTADLINGPLPILNYVYPQNLINAKIQTKAVIPILKLYEKPFCQC